MKLSEKWLREWVDPKLSRDELIAQLTMAGLAVEACERVDDDYVIEFELTPNRGDCLSVLGTAREIAAINNIPFKNKLFTEKDPTTNSPLQFSIQIDSPEDCPRYQARIIRGIHAEAKTPDWMQDKLTKSGIKTIIPVVDIMNFVMLELGQPLHAFDLEKLNEKIVVRHAKPNEKVTLLDGKTLTLLDDVLVIADAAKIQAIAGVMGSSDSAVLESTHSILIESAHFTPRIIAGIARRYGLSTDASHRFERGVDPELPEVALKRATELLSKVYGDALEIGPVINKTQTSQLPMVRPIELRHHRIETLLGIKISKDRILQLLQHDHMNIKSAENAWWVTPPSYRFDIQEEVDFIEEIARLHGYQNIPANHAITLAENTLPKESDLPLSRIKQLLIDSGYHEIISYSFISENEQKTFDPEQKAIALANPLSAELAVMRSNLWPGLVQAVLHNLNRQLDYLRFFETGMRFILNNETLIQEEVLSGVWAGFAFEEQWGEKTRPVDFYDIKNNVTQLFALTSMDDVQWKIAEHPALHPAQSAAIYRNNKQIGWCGGLHPALQNVLDIKIPVFLFEIHLGELKHSPLPSFQPISKFPTIRRDIALIVDRIITAENLEQCIRKIAGTFLMSITVFDVYLGKNIPENKKSIALGLVFQATDRTLVEDEINHIMESIKNVLKAEFDATLRE